MSDNIIKPEPRAQLLVGIFIDPLSGQIRVDAAPGVNPIITLSNAISAIEMARAEQASKSIVQAPAGARVPRSN